MTAGLPNQKNSLTPLAKSVILGLMTAASARDTAIEKKHFGSETILVFSNKEKMISESFLSLSRTLIC